MTVVQPEPALRWARDRRFVLPLLATAVPLTLQHLLSSTRNVANTFLTGQLGGPEVAAVGFCGLVFMVVTLAVSGMADGGSVITTQVWGSGNVARTRQAVALTLLASGLIAVAASTGCFMWAERIAAIGTSDPVVQSIAGSYIRVAAWMVIPYAVICSLEAGLRSVGKAAVTIRFTVIGVIAHVALAHGLIFGRWGLPEMGVAGAAWAAVLSSALEALLLIGYIYGTRNPIAFGAGDLRNGLREGLLRKIGRVGAPVAVSSTSWGSGILVYGILVGQAGTTELTVMAMMSSVETIAMAFSSGLAGSAAVIVGQGIGEGQSEGDVWKTG
ncbi:MATE family efflux transporter, partial [Streptomyces ipomoeae]